MDKKLNFITKELIEKAAENIDNNGVPPKKEGKDYEVSINGKRYPFKLLIAEAAKVAGITRSTSDFGSNEENRKGFEELTGYSIIKKNSSSSVNDLKKLLEMNFNNIWRCADSNRWNYLKNNDLLSFEWIDPKTNYKKVEINKLRGQKSFNLWVNELAIGDLIFIMGKNTYFGIAIAKSTYNYQGPFINMGDSLDKQAIEVQYIHKVSKPINHLLKTHNNPPTFAKIDLYNFGLERVLRFLEDKVPEAFEALKNYFNSMDYNKYIDLLLLKKQIILQGPPGTGKTYTAKNIAEQLIFNNISADKKTQKQRIEESGRFKLIQFHPSYTYEDFVRGITARSVNNQIEYVTIDKTIAELANKAYQNYLDSKKDVSEISKENKIEQLLSLFADRVQEEIDANGVYNITDFVHISDVEEDAFRYTGEWHVSHRMKFKDLIVAQLNGAINRRDIKNVPGISGLAKQHASYFYRVLNKFQTEYETDLEKAETEKIPVPEAKNYVLLIDEINRANLPSVLGELIYALEYRGESVGSIYALDGDNSIILPENLYIIGTMNTADRSVGHIDYAIRRRFAFDNLLPNREVIETEEGKTYFDEVADLFTNGNLSADFQDSKDDLQIGHSYFMGEAEKLPARIKYEVIPILKEYLKDGIFKDDVREQIQQLENQLSL